MSQESSGPKTASIVAFIALAAAALVAIFFLVAAKPQQIAAPASFKPFTADDKSFTCVSPDGWRVGAQSAMGIKSAAYFEEGPAKVAIVSDLTGSLMGDMSRAANAGAEGLAGMIPGVSMPAPRPPVEALHTLGQGAVAGKFKEYEEGEPKAFQSKIGDTRYSEFTADGGFRVGKVKGYRVTMLGSERCVTIVCQCPEGSWDALRPAFTKIINSLAPGQG